MQICGDDLTKVEAVLDLPMALVLNDLSCKKELSDIKRSEEKDARQ